MVQPPEKSKEAARHPLRALNFQPGRVDAFATSDLARAKLFAIHAANALTTAQQVSTLSDAVEARHQIGVAQGVLTQRYGIDVERAFGIMQRYSSHAHLKLRDVAVSVVGLGDLPAAYDALSDRKTVV